MVPTIWDQAEYLYVNRSNKYVTSLSDEISLHLASGIIIFAAALIPLYLSFRLKSNLRVLTILLAVFIFTHGIYHMTYYAGLELLAEGLFRTLSIIVLIIFGLSYIYVVRSKKEQLTV